MSFEVTGVHHITLRLQDKDRSADFFEDVLGFTVDRSESERYRFIIGDTRFVLKNALEGTPDGDAFSEFRIGIDHIALTVEDRGELLKLLDRLAEKGVATQGIQKEHPRNKEFVCFRDPDNIQWEFFMK